MVTKFSYRPAWVLLAALLFPSLAMAQSKQEESSLIISICKPKLTESGRQSSFRLSYHYRFVTDAEGRAKSVETIRPEKDKQTTYKYLLDDSEVIPCIMRWKLGPLTKYFVYLSSIGTTVGPDTLGITNGKSSIHIEL